MIFRRALSSLLSFALLMPSLFLLATIAVHRLRVARYVTVPLGSTHDCTLLTHPSDNAKRIVLHPSSSCLFPNAYGPPTSFGRRKIPTIPTKHPILQPITTLHHRSHQPISPLLQPYPLQIPLSLPKEAQKDLKSVQSRPTQRSTSQRMNVRSVWILFNVEISLGYCLVGMFSIRMNVMSGC